MSELSKLRWRCRRGMRELDALLLSWLDSHYASASPQNRHLFAELLEKQDPDIMLLINEQCSQSMDGRYAIILKQLRVNT